MLRKPAEVLAGILATDGHRSTIPGIREAAASVVLAEAGPEMEQFPTAGQFSSWSGVAPGNNESAGLRKRAPALRGSPHMKAMLVESAWSASRTNGTAFQDRYQRLKARSGHKTAVVAVAHHLALVIYEVLRSGQPYERERTAQTKAAVQRLVRHHTRRLKHLHHWIQDLDDHNP